MVTPSARLSSMAAKSSQTARLFFMELASYLCEVGPLGAVIPSQAGKTIVYFWVRRPCRRLFLTFMANQIFRWLVATLS